MVKDSSWGKPVQMVVSVGSVTANALTSFSRFRFCQHAPVVVRAAHGSVLGWAAPVVTLHLDTMDNTRSDMRWQSLISNSSRCM